MPGRYVVLVLLVALPQLVAIRPPVPPAATDARLPPLQVGHTYYVVWPVYTESITIDSVEAAGWIRFHAPDKPTQLWWGNTVQITQALEVDPAGLPPPHADRTP